MASLALQAVYEYWNVDGYNEISPAGVAMVQFAFACVWNWDARPFPVFPLLASQWGDAGDWAAGDWLNGRGPALPPPAPSPLPAPPIFSSFPTLATLGWSTLVRPKFGTDLADHASGRSTRRARYAAANYDLELTYVLLRADAAHLEMQAIAGFFKQISGAATPFWIAPPGLSSATGQALGVGDGATTSFPLVRSWGAYIEPVAGTSEVGAVYLNGAPAPASAWSLPGSFHPAIVFSAAPDAGVIVAADFGVLWLCRFADDTLDFEEFMAMLFTLVVVKLTTVRL
ncbi:MAG: DUF2460 domain-containing protein [Hyphomicrobiales bacterium]|nr:DUF2460 domain-containing protein [Hyphomicrobiales bacterium]